MVRARCFNLSHMFFIFSIAAFIFISSATASIADSSGSDYTEIVLPGPRIDNSSLATADFNGDGYKEIIAAGKTGILYVVSTADGFNWTNVWARQTNDDITAAGPPTVTSAGRIESTPAIADLDGNGTLEIVVTLGGDVHGPELDTHVNGGVLVYTYVSPWNFTLIETLSGDGSSGWPQPRIDQVGWPPPGYSESDGFWDGITTTPALGDLDGDGDLEIVVEGIDRRLHAWHHTGAVVDGWPLYSGNGDNMSRGGLASPAIGDLDGDGDMEVVFGTMNQATTLWAVNGDSTPVPGFPIAVEQFIHSSPSLGDLDGDGDLEIVTGSGWGKAGGRQNVVFAWHHDGTPVANWPRETQSVMQASPSLGDIDGDGDLEVVIGCGGFVDLNCDKLYAWHGDGTPVIGFPVTLPDPLTYTTFGLKAPMFSPILADFDGDGTVEILVTQYAAIGFLVVEPNGQISAAYRTPHGLQAAPMVDDVDNDRKLEILVGSSYAPTNEAAISIWHEEGASSSAQPWPMFRQNVQRAGDYRKPVAPEMSLSHSGLTFLHQHGERSDLSMSITLTNSGGGTFDWRVTHSIRGLSVTPSAGTFTGPTELTVSLDPSAYEDQGWVDMGDIMVVAEVDGSAVDGSPQQIPISFYSGLLFSTYLPMLNR